MSFGSGPWVKALFFLDSALMKWEKGGPRLAGY